MFTRNVSLSIGGALLLAVMFASPARAQDRWTPFASGFAGGSVIPALSVDVSEPATASRFNVRGRKIATAGIWGGAVGVWKQRDGSRLRWGLRGEASHQDADANMQLLPATGTVFGQSYAGPVPVPAAKGAATLVTGTFLFGYQLGDRAGSVFGRVMPYAGIGGGVDRVTATFPGLGSGTDIGPALQATAGLAVSMNQRVAAFAEYRHHYLSQSMVVSTQTTDYSVRPNHVVAGITLVLF